MSESDTQIRKVDNDDDDIEERGEQRGPPHARLQEEQRKEKRISRALTRKAKRVVLFPFTQARKHFITPPTRTGSQLYNNAPPPRHCGFPGKRVASATCFCFSRQPSTLDPQAESTISDPDDPSFTFDMLKALIEKNDFYSKECNPHLLDTSAG